MSEQPPLSGNAGNPPELPPPPGLSAGSSKTARKVVLGCSVVFCVCFAIAFALIHYFFNWVSSAEEAREKAYFTAAPGTRIFVSERDAVPAGLKDKFVPFAFHYPDTFAAVSDENAFIRIEKQEGGAALASFAVSPVTIPSPKAEGATFYPAMMKEMSKWLGSRASGYEELSQKAASFKSPHHYYDGWDMHWQSHETAAPGNVDFYGRVLFLRESKMSPGVMITMIARASDPAITRADDVGERGDLALILQSFRLISTSTNPATAGQQMSRTRGIRR
jgi:hypothetical protein